MMLDNLEQLALPDVESVETPAGSSTTPAPPPPP
eukprot:COSAG02_NODE_82323_length_102_cov_27629.333333_1_plen_33_part_11